MSKLKTISKRIKEFKRFLDKHFEGSITKYEDSLKKA